MCTSTPPPVARVGLPVHEVVGDHAVDQAVRLAGGSCVNSASSDIRWLVAVRRAASGAPALDRAVVVGENGASRRVRRRSASLSNERERFAGRRPVPPFELLLATCARVTPASMDSAINVALVIPLHGSAGIFGPPASSARELAAAEINAADGVLGRELRLVGDRRLGDAGSGRRRGRRARRRGLVDAVVGWHISAVRQAVAPRVAGLVPYVYTALYEGGERTPGVFLTGEIPSRQLLPAMRWLSREHGVRRWSIVGNDYVWPRVTARARASYARDVPTGRSATRRSSRSAAATGAPRSRPSSARAPTPCSCCSSAPTRSRSTARSPRPGSTAAAGGSAR